MVRVWCALWGACRPPQELSTSRLIGKAFCPLERAIGWSLGSTGEAGWDGGSRCLLSTDWGRTLAALPDGPGLHWPQALAVRWAAGGSPADWSLDLLTWEQPFLFQCPAC